VPASRPHSRAWTLPCVSVWCGHGLEFSPDDSIQSDSTLADRGVLSRPLVLPHSRSSSLHPAALCTNPAHVSNISFSLDGRVLAVGTCRRFCAVLSLLSAGTATAVLPALQGSADGHVFAYDAPGSAGIETGSTAPPDKKRTCGACLAHRAR